MMNHRSHTSLITAFAGLAVGFTHAHGDNWDNSAGNAQWATASNWVDNTVPTISDFALFPNTIPGGQSIITCPTNTFALSLNFLNSYTLIGGNIQLGNGTISGGGFSPIIRSALVGTGPLTFSGGGTISLLPISSNSYTGGTIISGTSTTVVITTNGALGFSTAPITLNGGRLRLDGSVNPTFIISRDITLGTSGGSIDLVNNAFLDFFKPFAANANALTVTGTGSAEFNIASTRSGNTTINGPLVRLRNAQALGTGTINVFNTGVLELANGLTYTMPTGMGGGGTLQGGTGTSTYNGSCNVFGASVTLNGGPTSNDTLIVGSNGVSVWNSGATTTTTVGQGTVRLLSANTYAGNWSINGGSLEIVSSGALGTGTTPVVVNGSGCCKLNVPSLARDITLNNPAGIELLQDCTMSGQITTPGAAAFVPFTGAGRELTLSGSATSFTYGSGISIHGGAIGVESLRVTDGADVSGPSMYIYGVAGVPGRVTVSGAGSTWTCTDEARIGNIGSGSLVVEAGGSFSCPDVYVGLIEDADATVSGEGSMLSCANLLAVGFASTSTLDVLSGADVTAGTIQIGQHSFSSGTATVSGSGSTLSSSGMLEVGDVGVGELSINTGGSVSCLGLTIGVGPLSSGTCTVTGGLSALNIGSAGVVMSQNGANSDLNLSGGIVDIHGHITDAGTGQSTFILDGATLDMNNNTIGGVNPIDIPVFRSGTLKNVGEINNGTGFNKDGTGTLFLNTTNTYSGSTSVSEGTLYLVDSGGSNTGSSTVVVGNLGTLVGNGRVAGQVFNDGHVSPQGFNFNSTATLHMLNTYTQVANGALDIQIESVGAYDTLEITGSAVLTGTLNVSFLNGYQPTTGDTFTILTASSVSGTFDTLNLPALNGGQTWQVEYPTGQVRLSIGSSCVADIDDGTATGTPDGGVTIDDLLYYLNIFNAGSLGADVDDGSATGTPDGGVTIDDLLYYLFRFNQGC